MTTPKQQILILSFRNNMNKKCSQRLNSAGKIILIKFYKQLKFYKYKWKAGIPIPAGLK